MEKYIALVPAYEPEPVFIRVLQDLKRQGVEIVVVDDGSGEAYRQIFREASQYAHILTHRKNQGKGAALKTGLQYIWEHCQGEEDTIAKSACQVEQQGKVENIRTGAGHNDKEYLLSWEASEGKEYSQGWKDDKDAGDNKETGCNIVTVDADGQHSAEDACRICHMAEHFPDTLILGSRRMKGKVPLRSRLGNGITRVVFRLTSGVKIYDTQTGLRAFHSTLIPKLLTVPGERYEYEMNVLLQFARDQIPIREETIETIYLSRNETSHFHTVKDSFRIYKEILKFSASSFISFLTDYCFYSLFLILGGSLTAANVCARLISASVNYTINRKFVFQNHDNFKKTAVQYFLLAAGILAGNTIVLNLLVRGLGMGELTAKILTELLFFLFSWLIQRSVIFKRKEQGVCFSKSI